MSIYTQASAAVGTRPAAEAPDITHGRACPTPRDSPGLVYDASRSFDTPLSAPKGSVSLPSSAASDAASSEGDSQVETAGPRPRLRHDPYRVAAQDPEPRVVFGVRHQALLPQCRFIAFPDQLATRATQQATPFQIRVAQLTFELTPGKLRWLIATVARVVPCGVTAAGGGAFVVSFRCRAHQDRARDRLFRSVLCDVHGVWAPRGAAERDAVERYIATREFEARGAQLPRGFVACTSIRQR